VPEVEMVREGG